jgi:hypothetical protein
MNLDHIRAILKNKGILCMDSTKNGNIINIGMVIKT